MVKSLHLNKAKFEIDFFVMAKVNNPAPINFVKNTQKING